MFAKLITYRAFFTLYGIPLTWLSIFKHISNLHLQLQLLLLEQNINVLAKVAYELSQPVCYTDFIPLLLISYTLICFKEIVTGTEQTVFKMKNSVEDSSYVVINSLVN